MLLGRRAMADTWQDQTFDPGQAEQIVRRLRLTSAFATYAERVAQGQDSDTAHVDTVRALLSADEVAAARQYSLALSDLPSGANLTAVGLGLCLQSLKRSALIWGALKDVDPAFLARHIPVEAVSAALLDGGPRATATASAIAADPDAIRTAALPRLSGRYLVGGHPDLARTMYDAAQAREDLSQAARRQLGNLAQWIEAAPETPGEAEVASGSGPVRLAILGYHRPGTESAAGNIGDHVQTLAMMGNLARFQGVRFRGTEGLGEFATELQARVRPELRIDEPRAEVELLEVSRDFSQGDPISEDTWLLAFGWHMHALYGIRFGLPYHDKLHPIFVAFHVNRIHSLTPEALDYLRAHGPIGCRDWTTVDLLLSAGVDAFFTGCLTTTINAVFPERSAEERSLVAAIDVPRETVKARRQVEEVTHFVSDWHEVGLVDGLREADELLHSYLRRYHRIVTSRLHSYLPATSLGIPVDFRPTVPGDVRFAGLDGMTPDNEAFVAMRDGIRALLAEMVALMVSGTEREAVYARWRELTSGRVTEARRRLAAPAAVDAHGFDLAAAMATVRASVHRSGPHEGIDPVAVTDVVLSASPAERDLLPTTLESISVNAQGPLRVFVTARSLDEAYRLWLGEAFPEVPLTFLDFDGVEFGGIRELLPDVQLADLDRLLLPELLPELRRITFVANDAVVLGDISVLARTDLEGHALAARTQPASAAQAWRTLGERLDPTAASELRRTMAATHPFDYQTFYAGVVVMDLERMRQDRFTERFVPMAVRYGLDREYALNAYAGPDRAELPSAWSAFPLWESVEAPQLVRYLRGRKPWESDLVPAGDLWRDYSERLHARVRTRQPRSAAQRSGRRSAG